MYKITILYLVLKKFVEVDGQRKFFGTETFLHVHVAASFWKLEKIMEEYKRACCIRGYHDYNVVTALFVKAFVHDRFLHPLFCAD